MEAYIIGIVVVSLLGWCIYRIKIQSDSDYNPVYRQSNMQINPTYPSNPDHNQARCSKCGSTNLQVLNQQVKVKRGQVYQLFMALLFVLTLGILWLLLGGFRKKVIQTYIVCLNCGYKRLI